MIYRDTKIHLLIVAILILSINTIVSGQSDIVNGNLIQFNDNGSWCWYQDERVVFDVAGGKLIVGSDASDNGVGGSSREGDVEVIIFDLLSGTSQ